MHNNNVKYIFYTIKSSFLPALCLAFGLMLFYAYQPYEMTTAYYLHYAIYIMSFFSLGALYFINRSKPFLTLLVGTACYILLNHIKIAQGQNFVLSPEYLCLCFLLPINLAVFYFLPPSRLKNIRNFYLINLTLFEAFLAQKFGEIVLQIPYINLTVGVMPMWAAMVWIFLLVLLALDICFRNTIVNTGLFYADTCLFFGLIYADGVSACVTFFFAFMLILSLTFVWDLHRLYRYDYLEGVGSYSSYLSQASTKFPFKYTIALLCIDNRETLFAKVGKHKMKILEQLIVNRIKEFSREIEVFRHERNEIILVFKNETAKQVMEYAEEIRRIIAGSEFIFSDKYSLKISVSICVSEKTRKDLNAAEVINRAHNTLQKANALNSNICMKA